MANWWQPAPRIEVHEGIKVVRDDLVPGGSKMRFLPYLVRDAEEIVFGGPFCGGAPYALSVWGAREDVKITLFYAKRKKLHPLQQAALANGATIYQIPHGYMTNVQAKAKAYAEQAGALFLPLGFDLPQAAEPFIQQIRVAADLAGPVDQVWCATGSGMLARCLGIAFAPVPVFGVRVGLKSRSDRQIFGDNVALLDCPYDFAQSPSIPCPFPSNGNYDRKAWEMCLDLGEGQTLFWNVLG